MFCLRDYASVWLGIYSCVVWVVDCWNGLFVLVMPSHGSVISFHAKVSRKTSLTVLVF